VIYLDNAATTFPKPIEVVNAVANAIKKYGVNPGRSSCELSIKTAGLVYECRKAVADFFEAKGPESVVFTLNCTLAINMVLKGLLKPGDHVVISCFEHNAVVRPLKKLCNSHISFSKVEIYPKNKEKTLLEFSKVVNEKTKLLVCLHASNVWGIRLPIEEIVDFAHKKGIQVLVDAAQTAGVIKINLKKSKIDFLCVSGHKNLYGPCGVGLLISDNIEKLDTILEGGTGTNSIFLDQPNEIPEKFESGTLNVPGILGLKKGIEFVNNLSTENMFKHKFELILYLYNNLSQISYIELYTDKPNFEHHVPILSFNVKNKKSEEVAFFLNSENICVRAGLHCAPLAHAFFKTLDKGAVRISPSIFTTKDNIDFLLNAIKKL
jgi:cysteine desulfurase family protein